MHFFSHMTSSFLRPKHWSKQQKFEHKNKNIHLRNLCKPMINAQLIKLSIQRLSTNTLKALFKMYNNTTNKWMQYIDTAQQSPTVSLYTTHGNIFDTSLLQDVPWLFCFHPGFRGCTLKVMHVQTLRR